jgi:CHAT domain-containing protein
LDAGISVGSDAEVLGHELLALDGCNPRLVVASACWTGIAAGYEAADEVLALSTVFIGAGAATAIASLWAVPDYATSLLMMSRFYELLGVGELTLSGTLRAAQLWLRDLSVIDEQRYLAERPILRRHQAEQAARGGRLLESLPSCTRRFAAPSCWAAWVVSGA